MGRGRPRSFDPDRVLESAMQTFWTSGYDAVGIADLCEATGIGRQSLYDAFGGKRALYAACLERYVRTRLHPIRDRLLGGPPGLAGIRAVLWRQVEAAAREGAPGCMVGVGIATWGTRDPAIARVLNRTIEEIEGWFEAALERARLAGDLPEGTRTREIASLLALTGQALALRSRTGPDRERATRAVRAVLALLEPSVSHSGTIGTKKRAARTRGLSRGPEPPPP